MAKSIFIIVAARFIYAFRFVHNTHVIALRHSPKQFKNVLFLFVRWTPKDYRKNRAREKYKKQFYLHWCLTKIRKSIQSMQKRTNANIYINGSGVVMEKIYYDQKCEQFQLRLQLYKSISIIDLYIGDGLSSPSLSTTLLHSLLFLWRLSSFGLFSAEANKDAYCIYYCKIKTEKNGANAENFPCFRHLLTIAYWTCWISDNNVWVCVSSKQFFHQQLVKQP